MAQKGTDDQTARAGLRQISTLRDHLAAAAMQGILASAFAREGRSSPTAADVARHAVEYADALVKELSRPSAGQ
jgi:2-polyprenyl-3-methyl-5-hydroxy-6-metoxy-1,4-benzoquinol methylase